MAMINAPIATNKGVRTQHPDYVRFTEQWKRCRDVVAGEDAVKKAATDYLPKLTKQDQNAYNAYLMRASFYNATARTIDGLIGMLFRKPPIPDLPTGIDPFLKDIDMCGKPMDDFASNICDEVLSVGRVGILVDHTEMVDTNGTPYTKAIAEANNMRPMLKMYCTENIINWRFAQVGNVWTLIQVVLTEQFSFPAVDPITQVQSEFENTTETRYRVLDLDPGGAYRVRMYRIDKDGNDQQIGADFYPLMNNVNMNFIPFIVVTPDGTNFVVQEPPLLDLVNVNLSHWRNSADHEHGCHFTALPTLFVAGYTQPVTEEGQAPDEIMLGSQSAICMSDSTAKAEFIEFTGQGLGAIEKVMDRKEAQMAILGARMLATEGKNQQSTTTTAIHRTGENSILSAISNSVSLGLGKALSWLSQWASYTQECVYQINKDFLPVTVDGPTLLALVAALQAGQMNEEEFFDWLQRADIIEAGIDFAEHKKGTFVDPPAAPALGGNMTKPVTTPIKLNPEKV